MIDRKYIGVVPARSGSEGFVDKNIAMFDGVPLLCHSLIHAASSRYLDHFVLWTDSEQYKAIASDYVDVGAEIGLRKKFVDSMATDWQFLEDLDQRLLAKGVAADAYVLLRPTTPLRESGIVDKCISVFDENWSFYDSLRTVSETEKSPYKMWYALDGPNKSLTGDPLCSRLSGAEDLHSMPRQMLPAVWLQNGVVDIIKKETLKQKSSAGKRVMLYITNDRVVDIDSKFDLEDII